MNTKTPAPWPEPDTQMFAFDAKLGSELKAGLLSLSDYLHARQCVNERDSQRELIASMELHGQRLESLNAELRSRVAAIVRRCDEIERQDGFYEAALAFARAHVESDRIDAIDDADDPDISAARWTEACARYNETKAALVAAYRALSASSGPEGRAEATPTAGRNDDHSPTPDATDGSRKQS